MANQGWPGQKLFDVCQISGESHRTAIGIKHEGTSS